MRGKNIMMVGPSGAGKTVAAKYLTKALQRPDFYFNLGATQDPRSTLIGNTHFSKEEGTYFAESLFVKAIQTENANILLDELSRAHPEAWNILMPVLDVNQRYLRLDEKDGSPTIKVASGVCFIATANIGNEYTATRVIDRAMMDRFITIEMEQLSDVEECRLLQLKYPNVTKKALQQIAEIASMTRNECAAESPKLTACISTRASIEAAGLLYDGFTLAEAAEVAFYPYFSPDGGIDSERTFVKQIVQKFCINPADEKKDLFGANDINKSSSPF
jgi:nitric oxide reductase NorQ protein